MNGTMHFNIVLSFEALFYHVINCFFLLKGEILRPEAVAKDDFCELLHFDHPYMRLGPFKLETLNKVRIHH
jgi:hypothetical protein